MRYHKAAEQGHAVAQCNLGVCFRDGAGVEQDLEKAKEWFSKAAAEGYSKAQSELDSLSKA